MVPIPITIDKHELVVRGIVDPLWGSTNKKKLKSNAFLPAPGNSEVSLLRHFYTDDNFCKVHSQAITIAKQTYCGLATFLVKHVDELNESGNFSVSAIIKATPLDHNSQLICGEVFKGQAGLPMHADLIYNTPLPKGEVSTGHRQFAHSIFKISNYFPDPEGSSESRVWTGKALCWEYPEGGNGPKNHI